MRQTYFLNGMIGVSIRRIIEANSSREAIEKAIEDYKNELLFNNDLPIDFYGNVSKAINAFDRDEEEE